MLCPRLRFRFSATLLFESEVCTWTRNLVINRDLCSQNRDPNQNSIHADHKKGREFSQRNLHFPSAESALPFISSIDGICSSCWRSCTSIGCTYLDIHLLLCSRNEIAVLFKSGQGWDGIGYQVLTCRSSEMVPVCQRLHQGQNFCKNA